MPGHWYTCVSQPMIPIVVQLSKMAVASFQKNMLTCSKLEIVFYHCFWRSVHGLASTKYQNWSLYWPSYECVDNKNGVVCL